MTTCTIKKMKVNSVDRELNRLHVGMKVFVYEHPYAHAQRISGTGFEKPLTIVILFSDTQGQLTLQPVVDLIPPKFKLIQATCCLRLR